MNANVNLTVKSSSGFLCHFSHGGLFFLLCVLDLDKKEQAVLLHFGKHDCTVVCLSGVRKVFHGKLNHFLASLTE